MTSLELTKEDETQAWLRKTEQISAEKYQLDLQSKLVHAKRQGIQEGRLEGEAKGRQEILDMIKCGIPQEKIIKGMSISEGARLKDEFERNQADIQRQMDFAKAQGRIKGREEGEEKGRQEILKLLKSGKPLEEILKEYGTE